MLFDFPSVNYDPSPQIVHECIVKAHERKSEDAWYIPLSSIAEKHLNTMTDEEMDADWCLNDLFGTIKVINLPSDEMRLEQIKEELRMIGVHSFDVFKAVNGRKDLPQSIWQKFGDSDGEMDISYCQGAAGCYMSHYKLIEQMKCSSDAALDEYKRAIDSRDENAIAQAKEEVRRLSRVLIFEDDAGFGFLANNSISKEKTGVLLRKALRELPDNWDILYFVVSARESTSKVTEHLYKVRRSWSTAGYAVNCSMYGPLTEFLKKIEYPHVNSLSPVDVELGRFQSNYNTFAIYPSIIYTQGGKSTITGQTWLPWQGQPIYPTPSDAKGYLASPRVVITLGSKCDFTERDLQQQINGVVVSGKKQHMEKKILKQDKAGNDHVIILKNDFSVLKAFFRKLGYYHLHVNDTYENAVKLVKDTLESAPKLDEDLPHQDPATVGRFYDLIKKVDRAFKANNIPYWATCGTLLGAVRHQGIIPWDDDLDLAIHEEDIPLFLDLEPALNQLGLGIVYHPRFEFYKIFFLEGDHIYKENGETYAWNFPFVDIFPLKNRKGKITYAGNDWYKDYGDRDYFTPEELEYPLEELTFGPLQIPVPHAPVNYLTRMYGTEWNDVAYMGYSHRYEESSTKIKVDLINRSPAEYVLEGASD